MTREETTASGPELALRAVLRDLAGATELSLRLLWVTDHRSDTRAVYELPISTELGRQLLDQVAQTAAAAADAELRPADPGFTAGAQQWLHTGLVEGPIADLEALVLSGTVEQYDQNTDFGQRNLLVLQLRDATGLDLARVYQGFSTEKALQRSKKIFAIWDGERFSSLNAEPLVIDRNLRLFVLGDTVVMKSNAAFESLFGPLPDLKLQAAATYAATLGKLNIIGGDALQAACESDLNMMRKLVSIQHKMTQPGYPEALDMPSVLTFLERNPHIDVEVDKTGDTPALVFSSQPQHRWALLKLLDDDFLRSDLTNINYEANSKTEVASH